MSIKQEVNQPSGTANLTSQKARLDELVKLVLNAAEAKGWLADATAQDKKSFKYATIAVSSTSPNTCESVSGVLEITCDKRIRVTHHGTSFHSYGLVDLYDAVWNEVLQLPWIKNKDEKEPKKQLSDVALIARFLRRFHLTVRQLKHRNADRPALTIEDEYDIQDLLHAFLRGLFDDIRPEGKEGPW